MKEIFLDKKWIGCIALCIYSLIASLYGSRLIKEFTAAYLPVAVEETAAFLPITFQNGEIVAPQNTVINKTYGYNNKMQVVLDTRVDEFEATTLHEQGVYISKKYAYVVRDNKTEIHNFNTIPDTVVTKETIQAGANFIQQKINHYLFIVLFAVCLSISALMVLLYTALTHWLIHIMYGAKFAQTLRINSLFYVLIGAGQVIGLRPGFLTVLLILAGVNIFINYVLKNQ